MVLPPGTCVWQTCFGVASRRMCGSAMVLLPGACVEDLCAFSATAGSGAAAAARCVCS